MREDIAKSVFLFKQKAIYSFLNFDYVLPESQQMTQRARMSGVGTMTKDALVSTYTTTMVLLKAINQKNQWDLNRAHLSLARVKGKSSRWLLWLEDR